ncbi:MAG: hypothetical protein V1817_03885 [Candidatus Micrarchaeota archaeon]
MGLLDFLFKKNKPAQPSQPFRAPNATLSELAQRAEEAKRKEIDAALPEVEASAHRIRSQWSHLEKKTTGLAKKPVRSGIDGEKIAEQSRDAFARRTEQLFKSSVFPESRERERDIDSFSRFAHDFEDVLHKFARALADNKYLFLFFREDTEEIGRSINELNDEALTLKHSVEAARKNSEKYATLLRRIGELEALRGKNAEFEGKARSAEEEVVRWTEKEKQAQTEFALEEKNAAQSKIEIAALDNDAWTAENEITQLIAPLQRPFRKLEKLLESRETQAPQATQESRPRAHVDKQLLHSLASYAANLVLALENDAESHKLAAACAELEKNVTELNFDLKDSEKIQDACDAVRGGKIRSLWSVRTDALRRKEQKSEALAPLEKAKTALEDASAHRQEASLELKAAQAKLAENAAAIRLEKDAINKAANSLFKLSLRE